MSKLLLSIFKDQGDADDAVNAFNKMGINAKNISVIRQKAEGEEVVQSTGDKLAEGAGSGALTGAAVGGVAGLLIGIGAIVIPGIGGLLVGGPFAAALGLTGAAASTATGALTGALAGGLIGSLVNLGLPEETAKEYENQIKNGGILVAIPVGNGQESEIKSILNVSNAKNINEVDTKD